MPSLRDWNILKAPHFYPLLILGPTPLPMAFPTVLGCWCKWLVLLCLPTEVWATYLPQQQTILHLQIRWNFYKYLMFSRSSCPFRSPLCSLVSLCCLRSGQCDPSSLLQGQTRISSTRGTQSGRRHLYHCWPWFSPHFLLAHSLSVHLPIFLNLELDSYYRCD